jgi:hypothetical protein
MVRHEGFLSCFNKFQKDQVKYWSAARDLIYSEIRSPVRRDRISDEDCLEWTVRNLLRRLDERLCG